MLDRGEAWIGRVAALKTLRQEIASLEAGLQQELRPGAAAHTLPSTHHAAQALLGSGNCVVQIIAVPGSGYHAFVVGPEFWDITRLFLGPVEPIDTAARQARTLLEKPQPTELVGATGPVLSLSRLVLEPLRPVLENRRQITFVSAGPLMHVPLGCLPFGAEAQPMLTGFAIDHLDRLDHLVELGGTSMVGLPAPPMSSDVMVAAPNFDLGGTPDSIQGRRVFDDLSDTSREAELIPEAVTLVGNRAVRSPCFRCAHHGSCTLRPMGLRFLSSASRRRTS